MQGWLLKMLSDLVLLLALELLFVEVELLTLEDVAISATALTRAAGKADENAAASELVVDGVVNLGVGEASGELGADVLGAGVGVLLLLLGLGLALLAELLTVMLHEPRLEGSGIDLANGALDESLGTDQFVVGGVVDDVEDTALAGDVLGTPGEVALIQTESAELQVATTTADGADTLGGAVNKLGHGGGAADLKLALLLMNVTATCRQFQRRFQTKFIRKQNLRSCFNQNVFR